MWIARGSWSYASNKTITDTGCGNIHLAGCTIEVISEVISSSEFAFTIRIITPTTTSGGGTTGAEFVYVNNGPTYLPGWRRIYTTAWKPNADDVGALPSGGTAVAAAKLATARTIGGVSFDGTANINLPGVNIAGNQSTTGNAATATKLATARTISGVSFDGTSNITLTAADVLAIPVKKPHLADWTSAPEMAGKLYVGGYQSPDEVASYMSFGAGGGQRMDIFLDGEMYVGEGLQKVYHQGNKPTAEDVGATSREVYVGEGFRSLGPLQSNVGGDYLYRWYKLCEHTTSALVDTTFDIIVSADKNYAGSSGRYYVSVSRYEGSGDPVGSLHVSVNRKYGAPDMIELAVKKEAGGTTVWVRCKRMWGNIGVSVINRGTDGGKPTFVADGTFVLSND